MKANRSDKIWNTISALVLALVVLVLGRLVWQIWKLNMLPGKYFLILCAASLVLIVLLSLFMFTKKRGKWQKKARHGKQVFGYILSILIVAGCLVGSGAVGRVLNTVTSITAPQKVSVVLEVYVRADDKAEYLQDTAGYTFALPEDISQTEIAPVLDELKELLGGDLTTKLYPNITTQMEALFSGDADAVILNSAYLTILEDVEGFEDYESKIRLIHEEIVEQEVPQETQSASKLPLIPVRPQKPEEEAYTGMLLYASGIDSRHNVHTNGRSDVNILVAVNPVTHQILLINTPRDTYVENPASGKNAMDKLTHLGLWGTENSMEALGILYGFEPEYSARINFSGFETLVDAVGGVTIYSDVAFTAYGQTYIQKGANYLNGEQALHFARERKTLAGGDNTRGKNQMKLIAAIVDKMSASTLLRNYDEILESLEGMFVTDMPAEKIGQLVQTQLSEMPKWEIFSCALTGQGTSDKCWSSGTYAYVMYPDEESVEHISELIEMVLKGETLTQDIVNGNS